MLLKLFADDSMGRRFTDVMNDERYSFEDITKFFEDEKRQERMLIAQPHFNVPPLAGVAIELENDPRFAFLKDADKKETLRLRQAIGVLVKVIMQYHGWKKTGNKGPLGRVSNIFTFSELYNSPS